MAPQLRELLAAYALDGIWLTGAQEAPDCRCERCAESATALSAIDPLLDACLRLVREEGGRCAVASDGRIVSTGTGTEPAAVMSIHCLPAAYGAERASRCGRQLAGLAAHWALLVSPTLDAGADTSGHRWKSVTHLCQEAAVIAATGGSILVTSPVDAEGRPIPWQQDRLAEVSRFWRDREPALRETAPVAQALVLGAPRPDGGDSSTSDIADAGPAEEGALHGLLELGWSTEWRSAAAVDAGVDRFPLIVVAGNHGTAGGLLPERNNPEKVMALLDRYGALSADARETFRRMAVEAVQQAESTAEADRPGGSSRLQAWLESYVWFGGCLLLSGKGLSGAWGSLLGVAPAGAPRSGEHYALVGRGCVSVGAGWEPVIVLDAEPVVALCGGPDPVRDRLPFPAVTRRHLGFGTVIGVYGPLMEHFERSPQPEVRSLLGALIQGSGVRPGIEGGLPPWIEVCLRRRRRELIIHLVNRGSEQAPSARAMIVEAAPVLRSVGLRVRLEGQPEGVRLVPDAPGLVWTWEEGVLTVHLPQLGLHEIVVVQLGED
jgi:hypothetical protein